MWEEFLATPEAEKVSLAWVRTVQEQAVSLALAESVGVEHKHPQALLIKNRKAVWSEAKKNVTLDALKSAANL